MNREVCFCDIVLEIVSDAFCITERNTRKENIFFHHYVCTGFIVAIIKKWVPLLPTDNPCCLNLYSTFCLAVKGKNSYLQILCRYKHKEVK